METSYKDNRVVVIDDFLGPEEQIDLLQYFDAAAFRPVLPDAWGSAYRIDDGNPLVGVEMLSDGIRDDDSRCVFPTGTALDVIVQRVTESRHISRDIVGDKDQEWDYFTICPYVYPVGSAIGWHSDKHGSGAFVYYAHQSWGANWGGELLVAYVSKDCGPNSASNRGIFRNEAIEAALHQGVGYYFAPAPNRIVFLRQGTPHMVNRVRSAAGEKARLSVAGFFLNETHRSVAKSDTSA